jgi:predicted O-linked N-acetylglucosamine transferase (SPINDLY family)
MSATETTGIHTLLREAVALHNRGRLQEAEEIYRAVLKAAPEQSDALHLLGILAAQRGDSAGAAELIGRALLCDPQNAAAFYNRGNALRDLKRYEEALASYDSALALRHDHLGALINRGATFEQMHRPADALQNYDRALLLEPNSPALLFNRGNALRDMGRLDEALAAYGRVLQVEPNSLAALNNRGTLLLRLMRFEDAVGHFDRILALAPSNVEAIANRGIALMHLKRYGEAISALDSAIAHEPDFAKTYVARGNLFSELFQYDRAFLDYDKAWRLDPDLNYVEGFRLHAKMLVCDWSRFAEESASLCRRVMAGKRASEPFPLLAISTSPEEQLACAQAFSSDKHPPRARPLWSGERYGHDRIRVAYVSGEFREQATAYLTADLFETHDREQFELYAISTGPNDDSPMRRRLEATFDHFAEMSASSDSEIAEFVRNAEIDVLLNLNGYFGRDRTNVFAMRPAPVQVNYLGFPGTMGAPYMDYIIADRLVIPERDVGWYSEQVVYLPDCYQPNDRKKPIAERVPSRSENGLPGDGFVFCCFNNNHKLAPQFFDIWMRLLDAVPGSVLWLFEGNAAVRASLEREAANRGVSGTRLVFAPTVKLAEHLARASLADLFLDTLPHNAHTTASDALWCGVPVLTCLGTTFAGRVAASLLENVGLPELITTSMAQYEALALDLARNPERLRRLRSTLARNRDSCALFDTPRYARHLETSFRTMRDRAEAGLRPAGFAVDAVDA